MRSAPVRRTMPDPVEEPTLSIARVAAILGVSPRTAHYAASRGELVTIRVGKRIVVPTRQFLSDYGLAVESAPSSAQAG